MALHMRLGKTKWLNHAIAIWYISENLLSASNKNCSLADTILSGEMLDSVFS